MKEPAASKEKEGIRFVSMILIIIRNFLFLLFFKSSFAWPMSRVIEQLYIAY